MLTSPEFNRFIDARQSRQFCRLLSLNETAASLLNDIAIEDWSQVIKSAIWFGLGPVLYHRLKQLGISNQVPKKDWHRLKNLYLTSCANALLRRIELAKVVHAFQQVDIHCIALKGAHLAEMVYHEPALRLMADIDLMVHKEELPQAAAILNELGYQSTKKYWIDYEISVSHQLPSFYKPGCHPIELHWAILMPKLPFNVDVSGLWERANPLKIGEIEILGLSCEDFLLHLALHAAVQHHLVGGLRLVYDLAAALNHYRHEIDWILLEKRTITWNAQAPFYLMLALCQKLFGVEVPAEILHKIKPAWYTEDWLSAAEDLLFLSEDSYASFSTKLATFLNTPKLDQKIRYFLCQVFISREEMAKIYPVLPNSPKVYLYYSLRFGFLVKKHLATLIQSLHRDSQTQESIQLAYRIHKRADYLNSQLSRTFTEKDLGL